MYIEIIFTAQNNKYKWWLILQKSHEIMLIQHTVYGVNISSTEYNV